MTNENQIILWFPIKLYDKREPNYFVIVQKNYMTNENQIIL